MEPWTACEGGVSTYLGLALLALAAVGVLSALRLGCTSGHAYDVMSAWQRRALMRERAASNPAMPRR